MIVARQKITLVVGAIAFVFGSCGPRAHAQLPAGSIDTTVQPRAVPQDPLRREAADALDKRDYATAAKLLGTLADSNPADAHLLYDLGFAQEALDQTSSAQASYQRAIVADSSYFEPHLALGLLLARRGEYDKARVELLAAVNLQSSDQALRGRAYRALARIDQRSKPSVASDELLSAMKITPETSEDILLSGELAEASGDAVAAEAAYRRLLAAAPQDQDATAALTHLLIQQKRSNEAEALLTAALAKDPDNATLNGQLASIYQEQGKPANAIAILEKLHTARPGDPAVTRLLARLYTSAQVYDKAAPLYTTLVAASPNDPTLLDDSANAQIHLHNFREAEVLLKRAVAQPKAFPDGQSLGEAASHLAFAASSDNDPETALQALAIRATVLPNSPSSLFLAATAHDKLHHPKQAADLYKQFLSVANGKFPDEEWEARHRLITLDHTN